MNKMIRGKILPRNPYIPKGVAPAQFSPVLKFKIKYSFYVPELSKDLIWKR